MNRSGSRIVQKHLSSRTVDDTTPILATDDNANDELGQNFRERLQVTLSHELTDKTRKDYRNRLQRIINYFEQNCSAYYRVGARKTQRQKWKTQQCTSLEDSS
eukprot:scaffold350_cov133-Cylindrotheca_fusiformis.AAC.23